MTKRLGWKSCELRTRQLWQTRAEAAEQTPAKVVAQVRPVREGEEASQFKYYGRCILAQAGIASFVPKWFFGCIRAQHSATAATQLCRPLRLCCAKVPQFTQGEDPIVGYTAAVPGYFMHSFSNRHLKTKRSRLPPMLGPFHLHSRVGPGAYLSQLAAIQFKQYQS